MLLPDQISFWRQRFVVKDATTGSAIFRLEGTLEDRSAWGTDLDRVERDRILAET